MELFANLRPALTFEGLLDASSLKEDVVKGLDMLIVRELTGGIYFGEPRGVETMANGKRRGFDTQTYDEDEIRRVAAVGFGQLRHAAGAKSKAVRRDRYGQPFRRYSLGLRSHVDRLDRYAAIGIAWCAG